MCKFASSSRHHPSLKILGNFGGNLADAEVSWSPGNRKEGKRKKGKRKKGNLSLLTCSNTDQCLEPDMNNNARSLHHNSYSKSKNNTTCWMYVFNSYLWSTRPLCSNNAVGLFISGYRHWSVWLHVKSERFPFFRFPFFLARECFHSFRFPLFRFLLFRFLFFRFLSFLHPVTLRLPIVAWHWHLQVQNINVNIEVKSGQTISVIFNKMWQTYVQSVTDELYVKHFSVWNKNNSHVIKIHPQNTIAVKMKLTMKGSVS